MEVFALVFQAYGMSVLPLNLIKGTRSVKYERLENTEDIDDVEQQIEKLKSKVGPTKLHKALALCFLQNVTVLQSADYLHVMF